MARIGLAALIAGIVISAGCKTTTVIDEYRQDTSDAMTVGESVVVLGRRHEMDKETEEDFVACVGNELAKNGGGIQVIPEQQFLDAMYPWFESSTAPLDVKNLDKLMRIEKVAQRFEEFQIRYFIWLDGFTERTDSSGSVSCSIGPGGGGCFGFATWDDESHYEASIWDLDGAKVTGKISAEGQGTSYMPAIFVPIPLIANVKGAACDSMAAQLKSFIGTDGLAGGDGG
jgi:hypothetical protein